MINFKHLNIFFAPQKIKLIIQLIFIYLKIQIFLYPINNLNYQFSPYNCFIVYLIK